MNYTLITEDLIVGSQPQKIEDIDYLKEEENVAFILNLQQDKDIEFWGIDLQSIVTRCSELGIHHMRRPVSKSSRYLLFFKLVTRNRTPLPLKPLVYTSIQLCENNGNMYSLQKSTTSM